MTEHELRLTVKRQINSWLGLNQFDRSNQLILNIYNNHKPLARGYAIRQGDAWCATTVSAVAIALDLTDIMPTEVSCPQMISLYQMHKLSKWEENDAYKPNIGDIVLYDWQDSGIGDNTGVADHIGIVTDISGNSITVTEGNMSGRVGTRVLSVNGRYIRGYCLPNYAWKAAQISKHDNNGGDEEMPRWETIDDIPESPQQGYYKAQVERLINSGALAGKGMKSGKVIIDLTEDMLRSILINERITKALLGK